MILKFTFRNLRKHPFLNLIKIIGLSLALFGLILILLFLKRELSYDQYHSKSERIYRHTITMDSFFDGKHFARLYSGAYIPQMVDYFPEIESYVRLGRFRSSFIKNGEMFIEVNQAFQVDSTFLKIFDIDLLIGNPESILDEPGALIISESYSKKVFGEINPIGQVLTLPKDQNNAEDVDFIVKGIMKDFPKASHFHPEFIVSPLNREVFDSWAWVYLLLNENVNPDIVISKFKNFGSEAWNIDKNEIQLEPYLQNIEDIHLHSDKLREIESNGNMPIVYTLAIAALLLVFISMINYSNLNIGMAVFSDKFLYINKISGATKKINIRYFVLESVLISLFSVLITLFLLTLVDNYVKSNYGLNILEDKPLIIISVIIFSIISIISGILPISKSAIKNVNSFLNLTDNKQKRKGLSKGLILLQYTIMIALIMAVLVIHKQTMYSLNNSLGDNSKELICFENVHDNVQEDFSLFKDELLKYNTIESVTAMFEPPGGEANDMFPFEMEGYLPDETIEHDERIGVFPCDYDFAEVFRLHFIAGDNFSKKYEDVEGSGEYIINESTMKRLGYNDPNEIIGKEFALSFFTDFIKIPKGRIIGVVKDFHFSSLKKEIEPLVLFKRKQMWLGNFIVSFNSENKEKAMQDIKNVWNNLFANYPYEYEHVESMYKSVYKPELLQAKLLTIFTVISLFICSMGLLGMSMLVTQRRTKEIGVRKVNGGNILQIVFMLNWDLMKWILISFVISIPIAYYAMNKWLESFAYKIVLDWWFFVVSGLIAIAISLITVTITSMKAAASNPVGSLRYE
ncbi:MAG: hypothetical protein KOO66_05110 [Bacteroidales bacterium]|nr:hypothetical protein [Bacteroidales bacterium]